MIKRRDHAGQLLLTTLAVCWTFVGCSGNHGERGSLYVDAVVSRDMIQRPGDKEAGLPIEWALLPGGSQEALYLGPKYFVLLQIQNRTPRDVSSAVVAYFYSSASSVLEVKVLKDAGPIKPGEAAYFHLDTDGYAMYLQLSQQRSATGDRYRLLVLVGGDNKRTAYVADLPSFRELGEAREISLVFRETTDIPDVEAMQVVKKDEWPQRSTGMDVLPGPPALIRKQGSETAIYFYYKRP